VCKLTNTHQRQKKTHVQRTCKASELEDRTYNAPCAHWPNPTAAEINSSAPHLYALERTLTDARVRNNAWGVRVRTRGSYVISTLSARTAQLPPKQHTTHATADPDTWRAVHVLTHWATVSVTCFICAHGMSHPSVNVSSENKHGQKDARCVVTVAEVRAHSMSASCAYSGSPFEVNIEDVSDYALGRGKQWHVRYVFKVKVYKVF